MLIVSYSIPPVNRSKEINGYSTATSAWLVLADHGAELGGTRKGKLTLDNDKDGSIDPICDWSRRFDSLEDLEKVSGGMNPYCARVSALQVLQKMVDDTMVEFNKENTKNYDHLFN